LVRNLISKGIIGSHIPYPLPRNSGEFPDYSKLLYSSTVLGWNVRGGSERYISCDDHNIKQITKEIVEEPLETLRESEKINERNNDKQNRQPRLLEMKRKDSSVKQFDEFVFCRRQM